MTARTVRLFFVSLLMCALSAVVCAQPVPAVRDGVRYVTGGIGIDEVEVLRQMAPRYNLRMTFATKTGEYLSDVRVLISMGERRVFWVRTTGPFLYVHLPPGAYTVSTRYRHLQETQRVAVPAQGGADVHFYWDNPDRRDVMQLCAGCPKPVRRGSR